MDLKKEADKSRQEVRDSVKVYMEWMQKADDCWNNYLIFKKDKELAYFYEMYVTHRVLSSIQNLKINTQVELNDQLFDAVYANDEKLIERLLELGADKEIKNENGQTPSQFAKENGHIDAVYALGAGDEYEKELAEYEEERRAKKEGAFRL